MRPIQEIFDLMIAREYYSSIPHRWSRAYMCHSLDIAFGNGDITKYEHEYAKNQIQEYMTYLSSAGYGTLINCLQDVFPTYAERNRDLWFDNIIVSDSERIVFLCMPIYKDWENRPMKENNA